MGGEVIFQREDPRIDIHGTGLGISVTANEFCAVGEIGDCWENMYLLSKNYLFSLEIIKFLIKMFI